MTPAECSAILRRGFGPADLQWKVQTCGKNDRGIWARIVPYVDARAVINRLDEAFGPLGYSITYEPVAVGPHAGMKCRIDANVYVEEGDNRRLCGVTREDVSEASDIEPLKGAASGALKRAFVQLGGGAYLYESPDFYAVVSTDMKSQLRYRGRTTERDGKEAFKWDLPAEAFQWMETTSGIAAAPSAAATASGPASAKSSPAASSPSPAASASPASKPRESGAASPVMPGKPGMWKDKSQVSWAGKPISEVPFAMLKECLEYSLVKAEKPDNKYAKFAAQDADICRAEMGRREDSAIVEPATGGGPGMESLDEDEWPEEDPFAEEG